MNPTQEQLNARLNPQATNIYLPQDGAFTNVGGYGETIFLKQGNSLKNFNITSLLSDAERTSAGNYGAQIQMAKQRVKDLYGFDSSSLPQVNMGDYYQQLASQGIGGAIESKDINEFLKATPSQLQQQTINATPNTLSPDAKQPVNNQTPATVQPSTPQGSPQAQPNAPQQNQAITAPTQPAPSYTIQSGDTLSKIAQQYGTTVGQLMSINPQITDANKIYTGQKLNLAPQVQGGQNVQTGQAPQGMVDQAQAIQAEIDKMTSPANTGVPQEPKTQTGKTETQNIVDTWQKVSEELGLSDIKKAYEKTLTDSKEVEDKKAEEASKINNNPWYSEGKRQLELRKLESKYETKLNTLSNYAKLYDSMYQEGRDTAEFLTTGIQKDQQFALELAQKKQEALDKLMEQDIKPMSINGREVLVDLKSQTIVADLGASKVASSGTSGLTDYQQTQAFIGISNKYQADAIVNAGIKGQTAIAIADQVIANPNSATSQLKSLYSLVKNLDPDSAVREGELALANQTQSYFQTFSNSLARITEGRVVSPEAAVALAEATKELAGAWSQTAQRRTTQYQSQASTAGIGDTFSQYLGGFENSAQPTQSMTNWATDYNYTRDIEQARQAIQQGADEGAVRARLLTKYKEVNL